MSRRRRNQTEKKLEDDKIETINRLLKKQVTRRSNREKAGAADDSEADMEEDEATGIVEKKVVDPKQVRLELKQAPRPFFRYIQTTSGSTLNLPIEEDSEAQPYQNRWETVFTKRAAV
jgi:Ino eighty subunit 2